MSAGDQFVHSRPPQATAAHARARAAVRLQGLTRSWLVKLTGVLAAAWGVTLAPGLRGGAAHGLLGLALTVALFVVLLRVAGSLLIETLWSLRNRLIAAYVFVAVVPVVLIAAMVGIGAYIFYGQYAAFLLATQIEQRQASVDELNNLTLIAVQRDPNRSAAREEQLSSTYASYLFPAGTANSYFFQADGTPADQRTRSTFPSLVAWLPDQGFEGLVADPFGYTLIGYRKDGRSGQRVLTAYPFNGSSILDHMAARLGTIRLQRWEGQSLLTSSDGNAAPTDSPTVASTLPLPPRHNWLDREIVFPAFLPAWDWASGRQVKLLAQIATRPSLLNAQLFGDFSAASTGGPELALELLATVGVIFLVIEFFSLVAGVRMTRTVTLAVNDLYVGTEHVNRGDFEHRIPVRSRDQLAALEISFNDMTASIRRLLEEQRQKQRLESELAIAHEVQAQLFPRTPPKVPGLEIYGRCLPARVVSGDYYDFTDFGGGQVSLALGDISGKGISAALLMATIVASVRAFQPARRETALQAAAPEGATAAAAANAFSPARLLEQVNRQLYLSTPPEKYATLFYAVYDAGRRELRYTNAGHLPPVVINGGGARRLEAGGMVVGLFDAIQFEEGAVRLEPGDLLAAWSDGITEPENEYGVEFGEERLIQLLSDLRTQPLAAIADAVLAATHDWSGAEEQADDITLVLARVAN